MTMTRKRLLDEMGLSPHWRLREQSAIARRVAPVVAPAAQPTATDKPLAEPALPATGDALGARPEASSGAMMDERAQAIARMDWSELRRSIAACTACPLCAARQQAVPGVGDEAANWLFIGEGPGAEEDARGEPFVGPAGKLLDAMLAAIALKRGKDVYITNAVKCRPPTNRAPQAEEVSACAPYLRRQITLLAPKLIVLLGRAAAQAVLGASGSLASLRGETFAYHDGEQTIQMLVTYHPAYLLRTLPDKAKAWEDLCRARALMDTNAD